MSLTLLITTHDRSDLLARSLAALATRTHPDQILVVDDGGSDDCRGVVSKAVSLGLPAEYVRNENPGVTNCCHARNVGIRLARNEEILVSEPEVIFMTDVVAQLLEARREFPRECLFGATYKPRRPDESWRTSPLIGEYPHFTLYRREWLTEVGGYDETLPGPWGWDDVDLNHRLAEAGHPTLLISGARGWHQWHSPRVEPAHENEAHVRAKTWPKDIVANKEAPWGIIKTT